MPPLRIAHSTWGSTLHTFPTSLDSRALNAGACRTQDTKDWTQPAWPEPIGIAPCCKGLTAAPRMQAHRSSPSAVGWTGWTAAMMCPVYAVANLPRRNFDTTEFDLHLHAPSELLVAVVIFFQDVLVTSQCCCRVRCSRS